MNNKQNNGKLSGSTKDVLDLRSYVVEILDIANEAIVSIDDNHQIILFNKGAESIFNYAAEEAIGKPLSLLLPEHLADIHKNHILEFAETPVQSRLMGERQEISGRRKNGELFPAIASISKLDVDGRWVFSIVLRDITRRKKAELEREKMIAELSTINQAARDITSELVLEEVLHNIVKTVQILVGVKYTALGVHDKEGKLSRFITTKGNEAEAEKVGFLSIAHNIPEAFLKQEEALIVTDINKHLASIGFPDQQSALKNLLGVPVLSKGKLIGALYLAHKEDGTHFSQADCDLVERIVLHAAIAIENAHLYEKTQRLAILEERERFARDLHDGIIQSLYGIGLILEQINADTDLSSPITTQVNISIKSLANTITDIRNYIFDLRPVALANKGLQARLNGLVKELKVNTSLPIEAEIDPDIPLQLTELQSSHIFHIAHEALSNAARHAKADKIIVKLTHHKKTVTLIVEDNGIGFVPPNEIQYGHHGLGNIKTRAEQIDAILQINSTLGTGTCLKLVVAIR